MRTKVSTVIEESLFRRARLEALRQRRHISSVLEEALARYLAEQRTPAAAGSVAEESFGVLSAPRDVVEGVLEEEDGVFDT